MDREELARFRLEAEKPLSPKETIALLRSAKGLVEVMVETMKEQTAEIERLKLYTNPRLFAAASYVLDVMEQGGEGEALEEAMNQLSEAVTWWDSLPFDPAKDVEKLPKYEGVSDAN